MSRLSRSFINRWSAWKRACSAIDSQLFICLIKSYFQLGANVLARLHTSLTLREWISLEGRKPLLNYELSWVTPRQDARVALSTGLGKFFDYCCKSSWRLQRSPARTGSGFARLRGHGWIVSGVLIYFLDAVGVHGRSYSFILTIGLSSARPSQGTNTFDDGSFRRA